MYAMDNCLHLRTHFSFYEKVRSGLSTQSLLVVCVISRTQNFLTVSFKFLNSFLKVQMKCFFIAEFERAAKIRKITVYSFLISLLVPEL